MTIQDALKQKNMSIYRLAKASEVPYATVNDICRMPISMDQIRKAVTDLYGAWEVLPESSKAFIENVMEDGRFESLYEQTVSDEKEVGALLVQFEQKYPNIVTGKSVNDIAGNLQKKTDRASILAKLQERKTEIEQRTPAQKRDDHER